MGPQKEAFCIFILFSVIAISASKPTIVKDYGPFKPYAPHQFEKGADGKYYLKDEKRDSRNSTVEYVTPTLNKTEKDAQLATADAEEKNSIFYKTLGSEAMREKTEFSKEVPSSTEHGKVDSEHLKKEKSLVPAGTLSKDSKNDELNTNIDRSQKAEDSKVTEEMDTKYRVGEKKYVEEHKTGDAISEKNLETRISITVPPLEKSAVAQEEKLPEADREFAFDDPSFPSIPMMMSVLPFLLPLGYPSRNNIPLLPLPPALHISDRLPLPDDEESKNVELPKELVPNPKATKVAQDLISMILQKVAGKQLYTPTPLPSLPTTSKAVKDSETIESDGNPKVFDIMGKKYVVKSQTQEHPIHGMGRFFIRIMSLRPMELGVPPHTNKSLEKEKVTEVKHPEPITFNPVEHNVKKDYDSETRERKSGISFIPEKVTLEVASTKDSVDNGAKEMKTLEPILMKRKLPEDLTALKIDEIKMAEPEIPKFEILGSGNMDKKDLSHGQEEDTKGKTSLIEGQTDASSPSHAISTEDGSLEKSNLRTEVKPSSIPLEGDVKVFEGQGNGRETKNLNISDKNELLEFKIVTIGYGDENPAVKDSVRPGTNKAESDADTPKLHDKDMLMKEKSQSEGIDEEHKIKKEKEMLFMISEKKKDSRKKVLVESSGNNENIKKVKKYNSYKDKQSDDDDDTEDED